MRRNRRRRAERASPVFINRDAWTLPETVMQYLAGQEAASPPTCS